jgi:hypothetical protein
MSPVDLTIRYRPHHRSMTGGHPKELMNIKRVSEPDLMNKVASTVEIFIQMMQPKIEASSTPTKDEPITQKQPIRLRLAVAQRLLTQVTLLPRTTGLRQSSDRRI